MALPATAGGDDAVAVTTMPDDDFVEDVVVLDDLVDVQGWGVDLDAAAEFCDAYTAFLLANGNKKSADGAASSGGTGWMAGSYGAGDGEESSPRAQSSGVTTDDGPLVSSSAAAGDDDDAEDALLAYVNALERFLLMDGDGGFGEDDMLVAACSDDDGGGEKHAEGGFLCVGDYFGDDPLLAGGEAASVVAAPAGGGGGELKSGEEEEEEDEHDDLDAREDGQASRKRARNEIKGTSLMPWGELEVTRMHLARIQLPPPPLLACCM